MGSKVFRTGLEYLIMGVVWPVVGILALFAPGPVWWGAIVLAAAATSGLWVLLMVPWSFRISSGAVQLRYFPFGPYRRSVGRDEVTIFAARKPSPNFPGLRSPLRVELVRSRPIFAVRPLRIRTAYLSGRPSIQHFDRGGDQIVELLRVGGFQVQDDSITRPTG
jgi:hypothetical protein